LVLVNFDPLKATSQLPAHCELWDVLNVVLIAPERQQPIFEWLQQFLALDDYFVIVVQIEERGYCVE
jgi:hypothetical protein